MAKRVTKGNLWGFIQSRPYASVADIRRLFMMDVDGAAAVPTNEGAYYIGLPQDTADIIRQLWQEGRIILDLNPDVKARVVQGVYPARIPMGRQPLRPGGAAGSPASNGGAGYVTAAAPRRPAAGGPAGPAGAIAVAEPDGGPDLEGTGATEGDGGIADGGAADAGTTVGGKRRRRRKRRPGEGADVSADAETSADTTNGALPTRAAGGADNGPPA